jgi:hydrogenase maturation protease
MNHPSILIGIGNPLLQDDRAGIEVAERVQGLNLPVDVEIMHCVGFEVLDKILGYERAFVVDACMLGHEHGALLEVGVEDIFTQARLSASHAVTLGATLKTGLEIFPEEMPRDLRIFLIQAKTVEDFSPDLSPEVERGVSQAVERIAALLA